MTSAVSVASAEVRLDAHVGGGVEGGMIAESTRPDGVVEVGTAGEWLSSEKRIGVGLTMEVIARPGVDLARSEEAKFDLLFRFAHGPYRVGVGHGVRMMSPEPLDGMRQPLIYGLDWLRVDAAMALTRVRGHKAHAAVDAYFSFTVGCYLSRSAQMIEQPGARDTDACSDTITSTFVLGIQIGLTDR